MVPADASAWIPPRRDRDQVVEPERRERQPVVLVARVRDGQVLGRLPRRVVGARGGREVDAVPVGDVACCLPPARPDDGAPVRRQPHRHALSEEVVQGAMVRDTGQGEADVPRPARDGAGLGGRADRGGPPDRAVRRGAHRVDRRAPEVAEPPRRDVVHRRDLGGDVGAEVEQRVRQARAAAGACRPRRSRRGRWCRRRAWGRSARPTSMPWNSSCPRGPRRRSPTAARCPPGSRTRAAGAPGPGRRDVPERLPLVRAGNAVEVPRGQPYLGRPRCTAAERLDLVREHGVRVGVDVVDHRRHRRDSDRGVDRRVRRRRGRCPSRPSGSSTVLVTAPWNDAYCAVKTGG